MDENIKNLGSRLTSFLSLKGFNNNQIAKMVKSSASYIGEVLTGKKLPGSKFLFSLKRVFPDLDLNWLIAGSTTYDVTIGEHFNKIPFMEWLTCDQVTKEISISSQRFISIPDITLSGTYALEIKSDSMVNLFSPGDVLICMEIPLDMVKYGCTYVFVTEYGTDIKQYFFENGTIRLHSYNGKHPDISPKNLYAQFKILRIIHKFNDVQ